MPGERKEQSTKGEKGLVFSQGLNELGEKGSSRFEIGNIDEFVGGVGLVDGAGTDADGGEAGVVEVGGVGEPGGADKLTDLVVRLGGGQFFEPRVVGANIHGGSFACLGDGEGEAVLGDQFL